MPNTIDKFFTEADFKRIEEAVKDAENQTSGEVVPFAVHASDEYDEASWRAGMLLGVLALAVFVLFHYFSQSWQPLDFILVALITLGAAMIGVMLSLFVSPVKRLFAGNDVMDRRVAQRAAEAFLEEEVFNTRGRTGILIFMSMLERKVLVLGDSGINAKVQKSEWEGIVKTIVNGMKAGKPADGLVDAIRQCGELLKKEDVAIKADDKNELSNRMRTREK